MSMATVWSARSALDISLRSARVSAFSMPTVPRGGGRGEELGPLLCPTGTDDEAPGNEPCSSNEPIALHETSSLGAVALGAALDQELLSGGALERSNSFAAVALAALGAALEPALGPALERSRSLASISVALFLGTGGGEPKGSLGSGAKEVGGGPADCKFSLLPILLACGVCLVPAASVL
jgi:hypothetical protein